MKKAVFIFLALSTSVTAFMSYSLEEPYPGITSNSVIEIVHVVYDSTFDSTGIWLGTGGGASYSVDGGQAWQTFAVGSGLPRDEVSALAASVFNGTTYVWVSNSHTEYRSGESVPTGDGLSLTINNGEDWELVAVSEATWFGMLSYDLDMYHNHIYSACFYGGLIRSVNNGQTWEHLYLNASDSSDFVDSTYRSFSNRYFSVKVDSSLLPDTVSVWAGTALGINRFIFTDYDNTSLKQDTACQIIYDADDTTITEEQRLPGNFVVSLGINSPDTTTYIWAACRPGAGDFGQRYGVAYSTDYGSIWTTVIDEAGWDFAFIGDTVIVATDAGLYISSGDYQQWQIINEVIDSTGWLKYYDSPFYSVEAVGTVIWAGGADGVVRTDDGGNTWHVYRAQHHAEDHYAYPSPFSPIVSTRKGTTIHYKPPEDTEVTIKIYDFSLDLVRTVIEKQTRIGGVEADNDVWDGRNDKGEIVANGVYFYNIEMSTGQSLWGKVAVVR